MYSSSIFRAARLSAPLSARAFSTTPRSQLARMSLIGRLAAEPELINTSTGRELVRYAVGVSHGPSSDRKTSWFRIVAFEEGGPRRDFLLRVPKGSLVHLDAEARMSTFEDEAGKKHSKLDLVQRTLEVISRPRQASAEGEEHVEHAAASG